MSSRGLQLIVAAWLLAAPLYAQPGPRAVLLEFEGRVEVLRLASQDWLPASTNLVLHSGDTLRTADASRALVRMFDESMVRLGEASLLEIKPPPESKPNPVLNLLRGLLYFFHREERRDTRFETPVVSGAIRGTEFNLAVAENGRTVVSLLDGSVTLSNNMGRVDLVSGEEGTCDPGAAPDKSPVLDAVSVIQWSLHYPAVVDPAELSFSEDAQTALGASLKAYRSGDLRAAYDLFPDEPPDGTDAVGVYRAALLLSVGRVEPSTVLLSNLPASGPVSALRTLVAAARNEILLPGLRTSSQLPSGSERLAASYYLQSRSDLEQARKAARRATELSPDFGFAWARLATLEFSFGNIPGAEAALNTALTLAPRHAPAQALQGFVLAARHSFAEAQEAFGEAIGLDSAHANAWLGRGLVRIRRGDPDEGQRDLLAAAALEPNRAVLRSYLGKAYAQEGRLDQALHELDLAQTLDPNDPTAWLYRALALQENNRINPALRDLESSQQRNDNRQVHRSRLLLDQDRAVRGANLANIYEDAGMTDVARREAVSALNADYGNYAAHLFLANSYHLLIDPSQFSRRFETAAAAEYLSANLLAPVGAGTLSPALSQNEYSSLFERNRVGLMTDTSYASRGDWRHTTVQHLLLDRTSYAAEARYRLLNGQHPNSELEQLELELRVKHQLTRRDSVFVQVNYLQRDGGDLIQRYDPDRANRGLQFEETLEPMVVAGLHHQWSPASHTLFLGGYVDNDRHIEDENQQVMLQTRNPFSGAIIGVDPLLLLQDYRSQFELYTAEAQQIWWKEPFGLVAGGRYQTGEIEARNVQFDQPPIGTGPFVYSAFDRDTSDMERGTAYSYLHWHALASLRLTAGVSYDRLTHPENFRFNPGAVGEETEDQLSPKAGLIWQPMDDTTIRAGYAKALGGFGLDQSIRLEPTQVAGFNQAFRSVIPESVANAPSAEQVEVAGLSLEQRFPTDTYVAVSGDWLESEVDNEIGSIAFQASLIPTTFPVTVPQSLDYRERSVTATLHQLLGDEWTVGGHYRISRAELDWRFPSLPAPATYTGNLRPTQDLEGWLHHVNLFGVFNHPCGFFARADADWRQQSNQGYAPDLPGDDFWQFHTWVGYRFPQRRAEASVGVLNLTDQDYRLNPISLQPNLPRDRTFVARFRFSF